MAVNPSVSEREMFRESVRVPHQKSFKRRLENCFIVSYIMHQKGLLIKVICVKL
jgi:hypothetical protein